MPCVVGDNWGNFYVFKIFWCMKQKITVGVHIERLADNKWIIRESFPDQIMEALQVYIQEDLQELIENIFGHALFHFFWYILQDDIYPD